MKRFASGFCRAFRARISRRRREFSQRLGDRFITLSYLVLYTPMKPRSSLCMIVGAVPALPPVIGGWPPAVISISRPGSCSPSCSSGKFTRWRLRDCTATIMPKWASVPAVIAGWRQHQSPDCQSLRRVVGGELLPTLLGLAERHFIVAFFLGCGFLGSGIRLATSSTLPAPGNCSCVSLLTRAALVMALNEAVMSEALMIRTEGPRLKNRRLGLILALAMLLYIGAVIAFIIIY